MIQRYEVNFDSVRDMILELLDDEKVHTLEEIRALAPGRSADRALSMMMRGDEVFEVEPEAYIISQ